MLSEPLLIRIERLKTPIGQMLIVTDCDTNLRAVDWADCEQRMHRLLRIHCGSKGFRIDSSQSSSKAAAALDRYFQGDLTAIDTLAVQSRGTAFQREVWCA